MKFKRQIALLLTVIMCISLLQVSTAFAATVASGTCGVNLTYTLDDAGTLTISGSGAMTNWSSSSSVPWYSNRSSIKKVIIEDGVTSIGFKAFENCTSLSNITIPNSVTIIQSDAFLLCYSLESISIPDSVKIIYDYAFYKCTSLERVEIGSGVTSIYVYAFDGCDNLTDVYFDGTKEMWNSISIRSGNDALKNAYIHFATAHTKSTVTKSGAKIIVDTTVYNIDGTYDIVIVGYKNNRFVTMQRISHDQQNSPYIFTDDIDEIKVIVIDSLTTLTPLCDAEEILDEEWEIQ